MRSPRGRHSEVAPTTTDDGAKADWPAGGQRPWIPQEAGAIEETATEKTAKEETAKEEAANEAEGVRDECPPVILKIRNVSIVLR
ncbi:hypothetical protein NDU88_000065 [Pleurodeles waltl]|uniref:Uncharacterized protein n=1 Tax=Pleurodeles waltl TaxID=8319 RepID=A0AAV7KPB8_PLEWA|nr:hypothetical protein NDU88_000065 [Pleurodeles waltl]